VNRGIILFKCSVFICILILWASHTSAYVTCKTTGGKDIKWQTAAATYYINTSGGPTGSIDAIIAGMQTWTDVATSSFIFLYGGTTSSTAHGANDGINIVTFGILPVGTVGENRSWYKTWPPAQEGDLLDSDIRLNTYYAWSTTGASGAFDVQNIDTHEHGHSLCLEDLYSGVDSEKTMYGYASPGETKKQTLNQDDIEGISYLYACPNLPVRILGKSFEYSFIQDAYDASVNNDIILSQATVFPEDLFIDDISNKSVTLIGGYDCDYSTIIGITSLQGYMAISNGILSIENFDLQ